MSRPWRTQRLRRLVRGCAIVEEAVDAGTGTADVGSEGTKLARAARRAESSRGRSAGAGEISSSADGSERPAKRFAALAVAVGAVPLVESAVDVSRSTSSRRSQGSTKDDRVVGGQVESGEAGAVAAPELRPAREEEGHVRSDRRRKRGEVGGRERLRK